MPFNSLSDLPANVKKLSKKKQRQFMKVFNSAFKKSKSDRSAFRQANSVVFGGGIVNPGGDRGERELHGEEKYQAIERLRALGQYKETKVDLKIGSPVEVQ